jgi:hypothetical protein
VFNTGERRDLIDSPLWLGVLTLASTSLHAPLVLQVTGLALGVVVVLLVLATPRMVVAGACASLFLGLDGSFASQATSGTSAAIAALYLVGLYAIVRGTRSRPDSRPADLVIAAWVAAAPLVRTELAIVAVVAALGWGLADARRPRAWLPLGAALAVALTGFLVRRAYFGDLPAYWQPWPPTAGGVHHGLRVMTALAARRPLLVIGVLVFLGGVLTGRERPSRASGIHWGLLGLAGFALLPTGGRDVERYLVVMLPLAYLLAVEAVWRGSRTRLGLVAALLLVVAQPAWTWSPRGTRPEVRAAQARLGQWLATHARPGTVVGAREVGALGYYSGLRMEDALGQVSPRVAAARRTPFTTVPTTRRADFAAMLRQEPDLVLVSGNEPIPSSILYVPNLDAIPPSLRGAVAVYRWAGSPVWRDAPAVELSSAAAPAR